MKRVTSLRLDRLDKVYLKAKPMRIESLDVPFRGHRTLIVGSVELALQRFSLLESSSAYKGKNILVIQSQESSLGHPLIFRKRWDVTFRVKDSFDFQLLATYVSNAPKPSRVFWLTVGQFGQIGDIPRALWSRWTHDVSLIGCSEVGSIGGCEWETILFPLGHPVEKVERVLHGRGPTLLKELKEHWAELLDAKAAVAWVSSSNSIHWYDPAENVYDAPLYTKEEAAAVLQSLASWVRG